MTESATDLPSTEVAWAALFSRCQAVESWSDFRREMYRSGVLLSDYVTVLATIDADSEEIIEEGTVDQLRALLTDHVREERFAEGAGEEYFWSGTFDEILAALAFRMGMNYGTPRRVLPCPTCGDKVKIQTVVFGMPAGMPTPEEEERYYFAGCVVDDAAGDWYCASCEQFYAIPSTNLFEFLHRE